MSERIHALAFQLFGKSSLEECTTQEVENLANKYPYFAPAQFLLLQKLKTEDTAAYDVQLQKAVLYYHNPLEFEYFINSEKFYNYFPDAEAEREVIVSGDGEIYYEQEEVEEAAPLTVLDEEEKEEEIIEEPPTEAIEEEIEASESVEKTSVEEPVSAPTMAAEPKETTEYTAVEEASPIPSIEPPAEEKKKGVDLLFEPYHMVDYFASQGIKVSADDVPKDKFGKQLKSFTEWLKTMKRLPVTEVPKAGDAKAEQKVENLATHSVDDTDVVTEAMAEVWLKQGNIEKAIETYNKLSLLNPAKRAFFAAKIDNLKRS